MKTTEKKMKKNPKQTRKFLLYKPYLIMITFWDYISKYTIANKYTSNLKILSWDQPFPPPPYFQKHTDTYFLQIVSDFFLFCSFKLTHTMTGPPIPVTAQGSILFFVMRLKGQPCHKYSYFLLLFRENRLDIIVYILRRCDISTKQKI